MTLLVMNQRPGLHVLIVDDCQADCQLMRLWLKDSKAVREVSSVSHGQRALQFLRREGEFANSASPDLILLDVHLPDVDGLDVLAEIQADPRLKQFPVFILSGTYFEDDDRRARGLGARKYLVKPFNESEFALLLHAIEDVWSGPASGSVRS